MTVIAALELDDPVPLCEPPGSPDSPHDRLGPGIDHPYLLNRRVELHDHFSQFGFEGCGSTITRAPLKRLLQRPYHLGMGVPEYHRPPGQNVVNEGIPVHIVDLRAPGTPDEER